MVMMPFRLQLCKVQSSLDIIPCRLPDFFRFCCFFTTKFSQLFWGEVEGLGGYHPYYMTHKRTDLFCLCCTPYGARHTRPQSAGYFSGPPSSHLPCGADSVQQLGSRAGTLEPEHYHQWRERSGQGVCLLCIQPDWSVFTGSIIISCLVYF